MLQLTEPAHSSGVLKSRPRPFGSGRLFSWVLQQDIAVLPSAPHGDHAAGCSLVDLDFSPKIERSSHDDLVMGFGEAARFVISFANKTVRLVAAHPEADQSTIDHFVDDHVAPRVIAADGALVVHASAVVVGGQMVIFIGDTGAGKSTFAASMHAAGHTLLGDDAVVLSETEAGVIGEVVYPSLRLFRKSIDHVFAGKVETTPMAFYSDKLHVATPGLGAFEPVQYPLGAVFYLGETEAGVLLQPMFPSDACIGLIENSFALDPADHRAAVVRMAKGARIAAAVPCYELLYPRDFSSLDEARSQVLALMAAISTPA